MSAEEWSEIKQRLVQLEERMRKQEIRYGKLVAILTLILVIAFLWFLLFRV